MLEFINITLSSLDVNTEDALNKGKLLWDKIYSFILLNIWAPIRDYRFIVFGVLVILLIFLIIIWARKYVPSKGRITDIYNATGEKQAKKSKKEKENEIHNLPKEFYKRK